MRVDERTENSMARHHLQSGVSGVKRGRLRGEVEAHAKALARRSDGRYSESDGDRGVLRRRTWSIRRARRKCRSEEHTSELQSRLHLVCRLLLEKKKTTTRGIRQHHRED